MIEARVKEAEKEAQRFLKAVFAWYKRLSEDDYATYGSKEGGALRRASLDLTRALAAMRKV